MDLSVLVLLAIFAVVVLFLKSGQFSKQHPDTFPHEKQNMLLSHVPFLVCWRRLSANHIVFLQKS